MKWEQLSANSYTGWRDVSDELTVLKLETDSGGERFAKDSDLNWRQRIRFWWWRLLHKRKFIRRPRASWSQILTSFGIRDTKGLRRRVIDADTIPSNLDVPFQYVELIDLGMLCVVMGFKDITIDAERRSFQATGPSRSITTQEIQGFGKVLRFDGDIFRVSQSVFRAEPEENLIMASISTGVLDFGTFMPGGLYLPIDLLAKAIGLNFTNDQFEEALNDYIIGLEENEAGITGNMPKEASCFQDNMAELQASWRNKTLSSGNPPASPGWKIEVPERAGTDATGISQNPANSEYQGSFLSKIGQWQITTQVKIPTIYLAAMFCSVLGLVVGFPSREFLEPFLPWWHLEAKEIYRKVDREFAPCIELQRAIRSNKVPWVNRKSDRLSTRKPVATGGHSWGISSFTELYNDLPDGVRHGILQYASWSTKPDNEEYHVSGDENVTSPDCTRSIFMPHTLKLLREFRPSHWKDKVMPKQIYDAREQCTPEHFLWAQIILIDIAIRVIVTGDIAKIDSPDEKNPGMYSQQDECRQGEQRERAVAWDLRQIPLVNALAESLMVRNIDQAVKEPAEGENMEKWDLLPYLAKFDVVQCPDKDKVPLACEKLVLLLKIRALFVVALLILGPDTSDFYLAREQPMFMPMI